MLKSYDLSELFRKIITMTCSLAIKKLLRQAFCRNATRRALAMAAASNPGPVEVAKVPPPRAAVTREFPATVSEENPYQPSADELRRYFDLKGKIYLQGMTMRQFLALDEFTALPEPMKVQMVSEVVQMVNDGQLDDRQFMLGLPPSGSCDPPLASEPVPADVSIPPARSRIR
jgi:hypothetical protein